MTFTDRSLTCADCNAQFTFTVSEQEFYQTKGFTSDPRRCPDCRAARKRSRSDDGGSRGGPRREEREMHDAVCAQCGKNTQVPFVPSGARPVYCSDCFRAQSGDARGSSRPRSASWPPRGSGGAPCASPPSCRRSSFPSCSSSTSISG